MKLSLKDIKIQDVTKKKRAIRIFVAGAFLATGMLSLPSCGGQEADAKVTCSDTDVGPSADPANQGTSCNDTDTN